MCEEEEEEEEEQIDHEGKKKLSSRCLLLGPKAPFVRWSPGQPSKSYSGNVPWLLAKLFGRGRRKRLDGLCFLWLSASLSMFTWEDKGINKGLAGRAVEGVLDVLSTWLTTTSS